MSGIQRVLVAAVVLIAVATACGSDDDDTATATPPDQPAQTPGGTDADTTSTLGSGEWRLVAADIDGDELTLLVSHPVTIRAEGDRVRGTAACNGYGGAIVAGDLLFEGFEVTEMACDPVSAMTIESTYLQALGRVTGSERQGEALVLTGPGVELRFVVIEEIADVPLEDTLWVLDTLIEGDAASTGAGFSEATITFAADEAVGSDGCNNFSGGYELDSDRIRFGALRQTLMGCPDQISRQTQLIAEVIGSDPYFEISGETLTLTSPADAGLVYRAG